MFTSNYYYHFLRAYLFFRRSIHWNRQQVLDYQNQKLIEIVQHAGMHVPFYRELFKEIGLDIKKFKGIEDIRKIPLLDKEEIRKNPEQFLADNYKIYGGEWARTSGSTGTPLKLYIDNVSKAHKYAAVIRAYEQGGYNFYRRTLVVQGYTEAYKKPYGHRVSNNSLYFNASANDEETFLKFYPLLIRFKPKIIIGYAKTIAHMGQYIEKNKLQVPQIEGIINYGQSMPAETEGFLKRIFNCKVFDLYSHRENAALIHTHKDLTFRIADDFFYAETFSTGVEKEPDELVATSFYNYAMPLIRYKTRDQIEISTSQDGRFTMVNHILGRIDDKILLPNGKHIFFPDGALNYTEGIIASQYIQEKPDVLRINMIVDENFKEVFYSEIEKALIKRMGNQMKFEFTITNELERNTSGKIPFIINRLNK